MSRTWLPSAPPVLTMNELPAETDSGRTLFMEMWSPKTMMPRLLASAASFWELSWLCYHVRL
ncbi:hypothetical protein MC885_012067 [Smutsia gigantea]|nr:hypothetical protein MC885_012067 [Smutsia gigantea]